MCTNKRTDHLAPDNIELANHIGAWAIFLAWSNLSRFLGKAYFFGKVTTMAWYVAKKIMKIMVVITPSVAAFVFAFNMLLQPNPLVTFLCPNA
jgi:hypothetical protein